MDIMKSLACYFKDWEIFLVLTFLLMSFSACPSYDLTHRTRKMWLCLFALTSFTCRH